MLIQFNFKNFKSFKNDTTLDMSATSIKEHPYNLVQTNFGDKFLKAAAIYGANASGKSNVLEAFEFMRRFVLKSLDFQEEGDIPVKKFLFDANNENTSEFETFFHYDNVDYQYGFVSDKEKVHQEWLYAKYNKTTDFETLFERQNEEIICGPKLKEAENLIDLVEEATLFLTFVSKSKIEEVKKVFYWFLKTDIFGFGNVLTETILSRTVLQMKKFKNDDYREKFEKFLAAIDTGISGLRIEENELIDDKYSYKVYTKHKLINSNKYIEIPLKEESSGTQKMFSLFDVLMQSLELGSTLFLDELDAKLHPLLLRYIINMFHNEKINKNGAQLIYTTHDNYTLTKDIFRRDQIWFVEKDDLGVSNLYSLAEYKIEDKKVRNDATYYKDYLLGRYGAVPVLEEFKLTEDKNGK